MPQLLRHDRLGKLMSGCRELIRYVPLWSEFRFFDCVDQARRKDGARYFEPFCFGHAAKVGASRHLACSKGPKNVTAVRIMEILCSQHNVNDCACKTNRNLLAINHNRKAFQMKTLLLLFLVSAGTVSAQFSFPAYLPSECRTSAVSSFTGANDAEAVAIGCFGQKFEGIPGTTLNLGMDMTTGAAPLWFYVVGSESLDTAIGTALIRVANSCTTPPIGEVPEAVEPGDYANGPLPSSFIEGEDLIAKLMGNASYVAFRNKHSDSVPTLVILAVSPEESVYFPANSPLWVFSWMSASQTEQPFMCLVHATTGTTVCISGTETSTQDSEANLAGYYVFPNPASTSAMLAVPTSLLGSTVSVDAVSVTGQRLSLGSSQVVSIPMPINTANLTPGLWSIVVSSETSLQVLPLTITR